MKIVKAGYVITKPDLDDPVGAERVYREIEDAGRTCYKSKGTDGSSERFVRTIVKNGHEAMLEHGGMTVRFTVDRGVSHEIVRHRLASFAQESTRYCNYIADKFGNEITVVEPVWFAGMSEERKRKIRETDNPAFLPENFQVTKEDQQYRCWYDACLYAERAYFRLADMGMTPEQTRDILPTSLKTEIVVTANWREWRHILNLRAAGVTGKPHPQMMEVMVPLLNELRMKLPALFYDISVIE